MTGAGDKSTACGAKAVLLAAEELVAEIGASILAAHLNMAPHHIGDDGAYIGHWMQRPANDKRGFLSAAAHAQRPLDWLLAKSPPPEAAGEACLEEFHVAA